MIKLPLFILTLIFSCDQVNEAKFSNPIIWESNFTKPEFVKSFPSFSKADTSVYLARQGFIFKYNAVSGEELWKHSLLNMNSTYLENIHVDENRKEVLYVAPGEFGVLKTSGELKFHHQANLYYEKEDYQNDLYFYFAQVIGEDLVNQKAGIKRYNKHTESIEDITTAYKQSTFILNITIDENIIFLSCVGSNGETKESATGGIYAIDLNTKELVWKFEVEPEKYFDSWRQGGFSYPSIIHDNILFNSTNSNTEGLFTAYGLNKNTGEKLWELESIPIDQRPAIIDNTIFAFTHNSLTAINITNGNIVWKYELGHAALAHTYAYKGYFYFVYNEIMVFEPKTGKKLYTYNLHNGISRKSLGFGDDKIFVNGYDRLYALKAYHVLDK